MVLALADLVSRDASKIGRGGRAAMSQCNFGASVCSGCFSCSCSCSVKRCSCSIDRAIASFCYGHRAGWARVCDWLSTSDHAREPFDYEHEHRPPKRPRCCQRSHSYMLSLLIKSLVGDNACPCSSLFSPAGPASRHFGCRSDEVLRLPSDSTDSQVHRFSGLKGRQCNG
jgi:hypothetical protein